MAAIAPDVQFTWKHGIVAMVLWTNSSKRGKFLSFTITVQVSNASGGHSGTSSPFNVFRFRFAPLKLNLTLTLTLLTLNLVTLLNPTILQCMVLGGELLRDGLVGLWITGHYGRRSSNTIHCQMVDFNKVSRVRVMIRVSVSISFRLSVVPL